MEGQASNDYGNQSDGYGDKDQQVGTQKATASCDMLLDGFNRTLDAMMEGHSFQLSDVLGAITTLKIQVEEQILFQYRANLHAANAQRQAEAQRSNQPQD